MSIKSWKAEFYPYPASKFLSLHRNIDITIRALKHSLQKWRGLTKENLEKHGLYAEGHNIYKSDNYKSVFSVDAYSCALCALFYSDSPSKKGEVYFAVESGSLHPYRCSACPLVAVRGVPCDYLKKGEGDFTPYTQFAVDGDTKPMVKLLEKALAKFLERVNTPLVQLKEK